MALQWISSFIKIWNRLSCWRQTRSWVQQLPSRHRSRYTVMKSSRSALVAWGSFDSKVWLLVNVISIKAWLSDRQKDQRTDRCQPKWFLFAALLIVCNIEIFKKVYFALEWKCCIHTLYSPSTLGTYTHEYVIFWSLLSTHSHWNQQRRLWLSLWIWTLDITANNLLILSTSN